MPRDLRLGPAQPVPVRVRPEHDRHTFFINDVGQNTWEEIDEGIAGADYGWNVREGHCANGSTTELRRAAGRHDQPDLRLRPQRRAAPRSPAARSCPTACWPAAYDGAYLFADYVCGKIFRLKPGSGGTWTATDFATGLGGSSAVHLSSGRPAAGQALYYTTYAGGGQVRRIVSRRRQPPPTASSTPRRARARRR